MIRVTFLELLISFLEKTELERKEKYKEFKRRKEYFERELNKWNNSDKINLFDKYR